MEPKRQKKEEEFFSIPNISETLKISRAKAYRLLNDGELPFFDCGGVRRVARADLEQFIKKSRRQ